MPSFRLRRGAGRETSILLRGTTLFLQEARCGALGKGLTQVLNGTTLGFSNEHVYFASLGTRAAEMEPDSGTGKPFVTIALKGELYRWKR